MRKKILIGLVVLVLLAGGYYVYSRFRDSQKALASFASIETVPLEKGNLVLTTSAIGKVRSSQSTSLSWQTSGTVEAVEVKIGDKVKAGQKIAWLKQTSLPQNVITAIADQVNAQKSLDDLILSAETSKVQAIQDITNYEKDVKDAQYQLDNFTVPSNQAGLDTVTALEQMKKKLDQARKAFEPYKYASSTDETRKALKEALDQAQADYNAAVKRLEYEYKLEVAQANLDRAWKDFQKWRNGPDPAEVDAIKAKIAAAQATLSQAWIEAPFDGIITDAIPQPGDQVDAKDIAFRLDDLSTLYVDVDVPEIDIYQVSANQPVTITFDALRGKTYHGEVTQVAMVSTESNNLVNYKVTVKLTDMDSSVRPGMTSQVKIVVEQKQDVLLIPNQALQAENGKQHVFIQQPEGGYKPVEVTLGITTDTYSELVTGELKPGDQVVLNPAALKGDQQALPGNSFGSRGGTVIMTGPRGGGSNRYGGQRNNSGGTR